MPVTNLFSIKRGGIKVRVFRVFIKYFKKFPLMKSSIIQFFSSFHNSVQLGDSNLRVIMHGVLNLLINLVES